MTARVFLPLVLALGLVLGWALWVRAPSTAERDVAVAVEPPSETEVLARLARIETALAKLGGEGLVAAPLPSSLVPASPVDERRTEEMRPPAAPALDLAPLEAQMAALTRAVESLQQVVRAGGTSSAFPSAELLGLAPGPNRTELDVLIEMKRTGRVADINARVQWKSQQEVLATYGRPDTIYDDGRWLYDGRNEALKPKGYVGFSFISDFVSSVTVTVN